MTLHYFVNVSRLRFIEIGRFQQGFEVTVKYRYRLPQFVSDVSDEFAHNFSKAGLQIRMCWVESTTSKPSVSAERTARTSAASFETWRSSARWRANNCSKARPTRRARGVTLRRKVGGCSLRPILVRRCP